MINLNGKIIPEKEVNISIQNRALKYGDAIFDTLKYANKKIYFIEDHYFRLMSSMRMLRMEIPSAFTMSYYENEIMKTINNNNFIENSRVRVSIFREDGGLYLPKTNAICFLIEVNSFQIKTKENYEIELFKDFPIYSGLLSTIKTNNRMLNVLSSIFAEENKYQNCILINEKKHIVEANNANIFLISGNEIKTPALTEGCINGIIRKKIIELLIECKEFTINETSISPFELLKVDEVFITNSILEIQSVDKYRKKNYDTVKTQKIRELFIEKFL